MDKMLVATFNTEAEAYKGLSALKNLHEAGDITLYATAVLVKDASGAVTLKQKAEPGPVGTAFGALAGGVVGLLGGPIGVLAGASAGGLTGLLFDVAEWGMGEDLVNEVSKQLSPGKAVVLAEVDETWMAPIDTTLRQLGAVVSRRPRSDVVADQLVRESEAFDRELEQLGEELAHASAETKTAVQKEIDAVRKQREQTRAEAEAKLEQDKREADAKIQTLRAQMKDANDRQKMAIEKRIAQVNADYQVRSEKLENARQLTREALTS